MQLRQRKEKSNILSIINHFIYLQTTSASVTTTKKIVSFSLCVVVSGVRNHLNLLRFCCSSQCILLNLTFSLLEGKKSRLRRTSVTCKDFLCEKSMIKWRNTAYLVLKNRYIAFFYLTTFNFNQGHVCLMSYCFFSNIVILSS